LLSQIKNIFIAGLVLAVFAFEANGDELNNLKASWGNALKVAENIKRQPRQYQDSVCSRNIIGRIRSDRKLKGGKATATDTVKVLVIKAQFQLDADSNTTGNGHFDYIGNGEPLYVNNDPAQGHNIYYEPPHDSAYIHNQMLALRNYYWAVSGGKLYVEFKQAPQGDTAAYTLPYQMSFYSDFYNNWNNWGAGLYFLFRDAIKAADDDPVNIDFSDYHSFMIIHAGSCWQTDPYGADIPSVFISLGDQPLIVNAGQDTIYDGIIDAATQSQDGMVLGSQGEYAHEFGHQLGLPDLYDYTYESAGLGEWELMSWGSFNMNAYVPPHLSAWCKVFLGWSDPIDLQAGDNLEQVFRWSAKDPNAIVKVPINSHEYYLIENRRAWANPDSLVDFSDSIDYGYGSDHSARRTYRRGVLVQIDDYDMSLPFDLDKGGLLVYHIDEDLIRQRWDDNSLMTGNVKAVYLLEADHIQELRSWFSSPYSTIASPFDAYFKGNNDRLDDASNPATLANDGSSTHISISDISLPGDSMTARVKVGWSIKGFPVAIGDTVDWNSANFAVMYPGADTSYKVLIASGVNGTIYAWKPDGSGLFNHDTTIILAADDTVKIRAEIARLEDYSYVYSSPAVSDVDLDGVQDVFIASAHSMTEGQVYGFSLTPQTDTVLSPNGNPYMVRHATPLPGFPVTVPAPVFSSVVLGDITGDDTMEVMTAGDDMKLHVWDHAGNALLGFPKDLAMETRSTPALAEIDTTSPGKEVLVLSGDSRIFAFKGNGDLVRGFPVLQPWADIVSSSPAVGDLDRDGKPEIICSTNKGTYALNWNGEIMKGWPVSCVGAAISSPGLGDIDGDGYLEIAQPVDNKLYVYNYNGTLVDGFPVELSGSMLVQSSPIMADVDGDRLPEVIIGSPDNSLMAFNGDGSKAAGFPLTIGGRTYSTPLALDLDGDSSSIELAIASDDGLLYAWSLPYEFSDRTAQWKGFHNDQSNSGYVHWDPAKHPISAQQELVSNAYVYPNPAKNGMAKIRFSLSSSAEINVKIFDLAGYLVREINQLGFPGTENEVLWRFDLNNMAFGVYIIRLEAVSADKTQYKLIKAAVIR
jgi:M6 family metalloprotease-like protein